jgi:hypothetical protein
MKSGHYDSFSFHIIYIEKHRPLQDVFMKSGIYEHFSFHSNFIEGLSGQ